MNWDYVAGFFDGEGSVIDRGDGVRIQITQTQYEVLRSIQLFTKVGHVAAITKRQPHWKDSWVYYIAKQEDVLFFLQKVKSRTIVKRHTTQSLLPIVNGYLRKMRARQARLTKRISIAHSMREQGLTYREIGKRLKADHGHMRRLILKHS